MTVVDHDVRLHFRIHTGRGEAIRALDMSIPNTSSLSEVLAEVLDLAGAPQISVPWQALTPAGVELETNEAIASTGLHHGAVVMLRPRRPTPVPVLRDSAEAVSALASDTPVRWTSMAAAAIGSAGCALLITLSPAPLPLAAALGVAAMLLAGAFVLHTNALLLPLLVSFSALGAGVFVAQEAAKDAALGLVVGSSTGLLVALLAWLIARRRGEVHGAFRRSLAATVTALALLLGGAPAGAMYQRYSTQALGWLVGAAALICLLGLLLSILAPGIAARLAGLSVPRVPTAGEDFSHCDEDHEPHALQAQAIAARTLFDGIHLGLCAVLVPALLVLGVSAQPVVGLNQQPGATAGLSLCLALGVILHAHRHQSPLTIWCTWIIGMAALLTLSLAAASHGHWAMIALAALGCGAAAVAPVWTGRLRTLEPTTLVWLERIEAASVCLAVPLSLHILGLFQALRGYAG